MAVSNPQELLTLATVFKAVWHTCALTPPNSLAILWVIETQSSRRQRVVIAVIRQDQFYGWLLEVNPHSTRPGLAPCFGAGKG